MAVTAVPAGLRAVVERLVLPRENRRIAGMRDRLSAELTLLRKSSTAPAYVTERYAHMALGAGRSAISILSRRLEGDGASNVCDVLSPYMATGGEACP